MLGRKIDKSCRLLGRNFIIANDIQHVADLQREFEEGRKAEPPQYPGVIPLSLLSSR